MDRASFLYSAIAAAAGAATPVPKTTLSPSPTLAPWDQCLENPGLPYDRPLDFTMQTLDGPDFHLMAYRGRAVMLNIFATWCGPCNEEQPFVVELAERYAPQGLAIIGIDDREEDDAVRRYRKKFGITYPIAMDRRGGFSHVLEVGTRTDLNGALPGWIFIAPSGLLYCYLQGSRGKAELDYRIKKFLAETPPAVSPSPSA